MALVHDLGKPSRFVNMLRVAKPTSPMSVGTWILTAYGPLAGLAARPSWSAASLPRPLRLPARLLAASGRPAGLGAGLVAPAVASYTAVLLADTATPAWHEAYRELPFVFVGSAAAASGGLGMIGSPRCTRPGRRGGSPSAVRCSSWRPSTGWSSSMGLTAEPLHQGRAGTLMRASKALTVAGAVGAALLGRPQPGRCGAVRGRARWPVGVHPVRGVRGRAGVGAGPPVHGRPAAGAARAPTGRAG